MPKLVSFFLSFLIPVASCSASEYWVYIWLKSASTHLEGVCIRVALILRPIHLISKLASKGIQNLHERAQKRKKKV